MNFISKLFTYLHYFFIILYNRDNAAILNKPFIQDDRTLYRDIEAGLRQRTTATLTGLW